MTDDEKNSDRSMVQRFGDWLARDKEEKDADLAKLMKANIVLSFLTLCGVIGREGALAVWMMLGLP